MYQTIVEAVLDHSDKHPAKKAVCFRKSYITYSELGKYVCCFAELLKREHGINENSIVMITALSRPEFVISMLAVQFLGGTVVPVDKSAIEDTFYKIYQTVKPQCFLTDRKLENSSLSILPLKELYRTAVEQSNALEGGKLIDLYDLPDKDSIAEIIFTTGTTGMPKGAMLSYHNILVSTIYTRDGVSRTEDCVELLPLPLNHSFGLRVLRTLLYTGATAVLQNGFLFTQELLNNINEYDCNGLSIVPASLEQLYRNLGDKFAEIFGRFQYIEVSAGSLSVGMKQKLLYLIPYVHLFNVWGSSETGGVIFLDVTRHPEHLASLGKVAQGVEIAMIDEHGNRILASSPEQAGRLAMKGEMQMQGYCNLPELTAKTIIDGWLWTADQVYQTEDGFIYMLGRVDEILNVGGEKVSPIEIENAASMMKDIRECACIGVEDPNGLLGQIPVLFVVSDAMTLDQNKVRAFLSREVDIYKIPQKYVFVEKLPRNAMNKIDRRKLKELYEKDTEVNINNPVINAIYGRRSIRRFKEENIDHELLAKIVDCGRQAPSGHNMQAWRYTVLSSSKKIQELKQEITPVAKRRNVYFYGFENPAALILISNDLRDPYGVQDCSCAAQNIMLAAHSLGVGTVWINVLMTLCDEPDIRTLLSSYNIPENYNVWAMIALGYPANRPSVLAKKEDVVDWIE